MLLAPSSAPQGLPFLRAGPVPADVGRPSHQLSCCGQESRRWEQRSRLREGPCHGLRPRSTQHRCCCSPGSRGRTRSIADDRAYRHIAVLIAGIPPTIGWLVLYSNTPGLRGMRGRAHQRGPALPTSERRQDSAGNDRPLRSLRLRCHDSDRDGPDARRCCPTSARPDRGSQCWNSARSSRPARVPHSARVEQGRRDSAAPTSTLSPTRSIDEPANAILPLRVAGAPLAAHSCTVRCVVYVAYVGRRSRQVERQGESARLRPRRAIGRHGFRSTTRRGVRSGLASARRR